MGHSIEGRFPFLDYRVAGAGGAAARSAAAARAGGEVRAPQGRRPRLPAEIARGRSGPTARRSARSSSGPTRRSTSASCSTGERLDEAGLLLAGGGGAARREVRGGRAARAVRETDEMALVGSLSLMLLHDRFVESPSLAEPLVPTRGGRRRRGRACPGGAVRCPNRRMSAACSTRACSRPRAGPDARPSSPARAAELRGASRVATLRLARALQDAGLERGDRVASHGQHAGVRDGDLRDAARRRRLRRREPADEGGQARLRPRRLRGRRRCSPRAAADGVAAAATAAR